MTAEAPTRPLCSKEDCCHDAACVPALVFYPPRSVMNYYRTNAPLTRAILDLPLCAGCFLQTRVSDLATLDTLQGFARMIERSSGTACDVAGTKVARVELDDPEYLLLKRNQRPL